MSRRLLDHDPETGVSTYHHYDDIERRTTIETVQDVEPILELNKALYKDDSYSARGKKTEWWHYASIPVVVQEKWLRDYGVNIYNRNHERKVQSLLQDPEWRYLRTAPGRL